MAEISFVSNPALKTILSGWRGNPVIKGRFIDPQKKFSGSFKKFLKWKTAANVKATEKKNDTWRLSVQKGNDFLKRTDNLLTWLGHASFFIQLNDQRILIDPVFGKISGIVPRFSEMPCAVNEFVDIDYVLVSHAHRDHCDKKTLQQLFAQNPRAVLLAPIHTGRLVSSWVRGLSYQEAGWYQQFSLTEKNLQITLLPTQHWSNRYLTDINKTLYGSFMIEANGLNIFFNSDSGYCSYPQQIANLFPHIDIALIGVGAYHPPLMMKDVHTNPHEAVQIFKDLKAKTFIPMHYGTFDLADEPMGEPFRILQQLKTDGTIKDELRMAAVGEVVPL